MELTAKKGCNLINKNNKGGNAMKISEIYKIYKLYLDPSFKKLFPDPSVVTDSDLEIYPVVLTGGPCAGKTTAVNKVLRQAIAIPKCKVFVAQEAADHLKKGNINFFSAGRGQTFQRLIINHQLAAELAALIAAIFFKLLHPDWSVFVLCDRSIMDGQAYFKVASEFDEILKDFNLTVKDVYARSDMVVYLRSAAIGAEHAYTTSDGTMRDESIEEAALLDRKVYKAWCKHKNFVEVDNSFNFNEKLEYAISKIFSVGGINIPVKNCRRFIIRVPNAFVLHSNTSHLETFWDKSFFLKTDPSNPNMYRAIRIRTGGKTIAYHYSEQLWKMVPNPKNPHRTIENAVRDITFPTTESEVLGSMLEVDPHITCIEKMVHTFYVKKDIYCELSVFECNQDYGYLRVFFDCDEENVNEYIDYIMDVFKVIREVTFERKFCEYEIARSGGSVLSQL